MIFFKMLASQLKKNLGRNNKYKGLTALIANSKDMLIVIARRFIIKKKLIKNKFYLAPTLLVLSIMS